MKTTTEQTFKVKSCIEGFKFDITIIENEIRKFSHINNIKVIELYSEKSSWLRRTCFFELEGTEEKLNELCNYLELLKNG